jgi:hypothetical protein
MKDSQKTLSQEQKETVFEFVASCIKSGRKLRDCTFTHMKAIDDDDITYMISMSNFDVNRLFSISVCNDTLKLRISVQASEVLNRSVVDYIEKYMIALNSVELGELSDEEFNEITNLQIDLGATRSVKVRHLQEKIKDGQ